MEALTQIGVFAAETFIIVLGIAIVLLLIALLMAKSQLKPELEIELLHQKWKELRKNILGQTLPKKELKKILKEEKKKEDQDLEEKLPRIFILEFIGDVKASQTQALTTEINAILTVAQPEDEVVIKVESPGGAVPGYGLAASQLMRFRERNIPLTVCVDKIAASGGYLMSVPAQRIYASPFAIIGSIGVVAEFPNLNRLLKKYDVDYKEYTAGDYKRTVSLLGEITPKGESKFRQQLEDTHILFKEFVSRFRPQMDLGRVATGEYWYGNQALKLGLIDEIRTSDDYLMEKAKTHQIIKLKFEKKQSLQEKITGVFGQSLRRGLNLLLEDLDRKDSMIK